MDESGVATREELLARQREVGEGELATHPRTAPAHMTRQVLRFNEHVERVGEVAVVLVLGSLLSYAALRAVEWWFVPLLFLAVRPAAVWLGLIGSGVAGGERRLMGWFGIRGAGSVYYLAYAITHGLPEPLTERLASLTLAAVAASVVVHGISVTPLMRAYTGARGARPRAVVDAGRSDS
jgi:NhaP-type Na+/H+ or K+/H+ antiporter